jgi:hypothetical protein
VKNLKRFIIIVLLMVPIALSAQNSDEDKPDYGIHWSGFVKNDFFFDTRQVVSAREGHFLLYPTPVSLDVDDKDINAQGGLNFLSIQSRLTGKITGPDAFGAKTSGVIEGAFFGHSNLDINGFRLRHAFVKLDWTNTQLLFGQYWHMMFVPECFPGTISFNTGVPFQYFSRNPQIRLTQKIGDNAKFAIAAATQRDFASPGGYTSLSNAMIPDMQAQFQIKASDALLVGLTGGYKTLKPRLSTNANYIAENTVGGFTSNLFMRLKTEPITVKLQGIWAQNAFDGLMIGGFMIKDFTDPAKDYRSYTPINTMSAWLDIHTNGKKYQFGLFAGYSQNMGSFDEVADTVFNAGMNTSYARGANIDFLYRVSPRMHVNCGKFRLAGEVEYTVAAYATADEFGALNIDKYGKITESEMVGNVRLLMSAYYFF